MTTLADLFPHDTVANDRRADPRRADRASRRLETLLGPARPVAGASVAVDDTVALVELVGECAPVGEFMAAAAPALQRIRRGRSGRDWLSIVVAGVAAAVLTVASAVAAVTLSSRSPVADAMQELAHAETTLVDDIDATNRAIADAFTTDADAQALATALAAPLGAVAGMTDERARQAADAARVAYATETTAIVLPGLLAPYKRAAVDDESLESVAAATDAVGDRQLVAATARDRLAAGRVAQARAEQQFAAALAAFAATVPGSAATILGQNPDAPAELRARVTDTAATVAGASPGALGGALTAYAGAVTSLRLGQDAAAREFAAEAERLRLLAEESSSGETIVETAPTAPVETTPVEPVDPAEPTPEPAPTDAETPPAGG